MVERKKDHSRPPLILSVLLTLLIFSGSVLSISVAGGDYLTCGQLSRSSCPCRLEPEGTVGNYCYFSDQVYTETVANFFGLYNCLEVSTITDCGICVDERAFVDTDLVAYIFGSNVTNSALTCSGTESVVNINAATIPTGSFTDCSGLSTLMEAEACCDALRSQTLPNPVYRGTCANMTLVNADFAAIALVHNTLLCLDPLGTYGDACSNCLRNMSGVDAMATLPAGVSTSMTSVIYNLFSICDLSSSTSLTSFSIEATRKRSGTNAFIATTSETLDLSSDPPNIVRAKNALTEFVQKSTSVCQEAHFQAMYTVIANGLVDSRHSVGLNDIIYIEFFGVITNDDIKLIQSACAAHTLKVLRLGQTSLFDDNSCLDVLNTISGQCPTLEHVDLQNCAVAVDQTQAVFLAPLVTYKGATLFSQEAPEEFTPPATPGSPTALKYMTITAPFGADTLHTFVRSYYKQLCSMCILDDPSFSKRVNYPFAIAPGGGGGGPPPPPPGKRADKAHNGQRAAPPTNPYAPISGRCSRFDMVYDNPSNDFASVANNFVKSRTMCSIRIVQSTYQTTYSTIDITEPLSVGGCPSPSVVFKGVNVANQLTLVGGQDVAYVYLDNVVPPASDPLVPSTTVDGPVVLHVGRGSSGEILSVGSNTLSVRCLTGATFTVEDLYQVAVNDLKLYNLEHLAMDGCSFVDNSGAPITSHTISDLVDVVPNLKAVRVKNSGISGTIPTDLCNAAIGMGLDLRSINENADSTLRVLHIEGLSPPKSSDYFCVDVSGNALTGSIPDCFSHGELPSSCDYLDFSSNSLSGSIPDFGGLFHLDVSNNPSLVGTIPTTLKYSTHIDMSNTGITGTIPSEIFTSSLTYLSLSNCPSLTGTLPTEIGLAINLRTLLLQGTDVGVIPNEISCCSIDTLSVGGGSTAWASHELRVFMSSVSSIDDSTDGPSASTLWTVVLNNPDLETIVPGVTEFITCAVPRDPSSNILDLGTIADLVSVVHEAPVVIPEIDNGKRQVSQQQKRSGKTDSRNIVNKPGSTLAILPNLRGAVLTSGRKRDYSVKSLLPVDRKNTINSKAFSVSINHVMAQLVKDRVYYSDPRTNGVSTRIPAKKSESYTAHLGTYTACASGLSSTDTLNSTTPTGSGNLYTWNSNVTVSIDTAHPLVFNVYIPSEAYTLDATVGNIDLGFVSGPLISITNGSLITQFAIDLHAGFPAVIIPSFSPITLSDYVKLDTTGAGYTTSTLVSFCLDYNRMTLTLANNGVITCFLEQGTNDIHCSGDFSDSGIDHTYATYSFVDIVNMPLGGVISTSEYFSSLDLSTSVQLYSQYINSGISLVNQVIITLVSGGGVLTAQRSFITGGGERSPTSDSTVCSLFQDGVTTIFIPNGVTCDDTGALSGAVFSGIVEGPKTLLGEVVADYTPRMFTSPFMHLATFDEDTVTVDQTGAVLTSVSSLFDALFSGKQYMPFSTSGVVNCPTLSFGATVSSVTDAQDLLTYAGISYFSTGDADISAISQGFVPIWSSSFELHDPTCTGVLSVDDVGGDLVAVPYGGVRPPSMVSEMISNNASIATTYMFTNFGVEEFIERYGSTQTFVFNISGSGFLQVPYPRGYYDIYDISGNADMAGCIPIWITGFLGSGAYSDSQYVLQCYANNLKLDPHGMQGVCCAEAGGCCNNPDIPKCSPKGLTFCPFIEPWEFAFSTTIKRVESSLSYLQL